MKAFIRSNQLLKIANKALGIIFLLLPFALFTAGCGTVTTELVELSSYDYVKTEYDTTEVKKGDLTPEITLNLKTDGEDTIGYSFDYVFLDKIISEGLYLEKLHVSVGDTVSEGTVLVSLTSKELKEKLEVYQREKRENEALLEHYRILAATDPGTDYSSYINETVKSIQVDDLYIQETNAKLKEYSLIARKPGVVTHIDELLLNMEEGTVSEAILWMENDMITVSGITDTFFAVTEETDFFEVGKKYEADSGIGVYEMTLSEKDGNKVIFKTDSPLSASDVSSMTITAKKPTMKNVIYVKKSAIIKNGNEFIAYVKDENGYYDVRRVKTKEIIGDNIVISEGLSEGEEVALNR